MLDEPQRLTMSDVFTLFGRHSEDTRWVASADSQEYLAVVLIWFSGTTPAKRRPALVIVSLLD